MNRKLVISCALLMSLFSISLFAATASSKKVTFNSDVKVGNTVLKPGDYKVEWDGSGPSVEVKFLQGKKTVATAPATVENQSKAQSTQMVFDSGANNTQVLKKIQWKDLSLDFQGGSSGGGK